MRRLDSLRYGSEEKAALCTVDCPVCGSRHTDAQGLGFMRRLDSLRYSCSFDFFQKYQTDLGSRNGSEGAAGLQSLLVLKGSFPGREVDPQ